MTGRQLKKGKNTIIAILRFSNKVPSFDFSIKFSKEPTKGIELFTLMNPEEDDAC